MAMYYYASKLNEASCSGCNVKVPPAPTEPAPVPPPPADHAPLPPDPSLLHGTGLSYYDNDDYYSMVRGNNFMTETSCKHIVMNGGINFVATQKAETPQLSSVVAPEVKALSSSPYVNPPADKSDIEYKDGLIISAPLETLVDMLRPGASKSFMFTFLLCSRLFVKPHELLSKLCKRYFKNYDKIGKNEVKDLIEKELNDMIALVRVLNQWTSMFPYDFRDDRVMALVRSITQRCAAEHMASVRLEVSTMLEKLLDKLTALEQYEETLVEVPQVTSVDQLAQGDILTLGLSPVELANQLTVVELHRLSFVGPEEFVQTFAPAQPPQSTSACGKSSINLHHIETKSTRNLEAYADWFNRLSYLVATDILKSVKSKYRARVIEQWVMTARECFNLGNFNSLMAIISALNMSSITRLKKTGVRKDMMSLFHALSVFKSVANAKAGNILSDAAYGRGLQPRLISVHGPRTLLADAMSWGRTSGVCGQQLRQLELCVEPSGNHARYRAALAAAPTETAVPLLSVTCRDLHFANQGAPSKVAGSRVNFEKCSLLARHVGTQLAARRLASDEAPAPALPAPLLPVWRFLNERPALSETALELISFEREPPVDHLEKERLKRLRGAT